MPHSLPQVHTLTPAQMEEAYRIWSLAFERGNRNMEEWRRGTEASPEGTVTLGISEDDRLQSVLRIINFRCYFGPDISLPMGGINGVASLPASRARGYAGACLDHALAQMRDAGQVISALYPFSWEFYQRYGWEWVGAARHYALPTSIIKPCAQTEDVREATVSDHAAIRDVYARKARGYRGATIRTDFQWNEILADTGDQYTSVYVYENAGGLEGYLAYRGGNQENVGLREFVALTPIAQRALLGLLRRQNMQFRKVSWKAPEDDPLWSQVYHWEIETKLLPIFMGRIVDVKGALEAWRAPEDRNTSLTLSVKDDHASWNEGTWQIACETGKISAQSTTKAPQISLDIQALSQAYFGRPTLSDLRAADRISVHDEAAFDAFSGLLAGPPTWLNDFF